MIQADTMTGAGLLRYTLTIVIWMSFVYGFFVYNGTYETCRSESGKPIKNQ